MIRPLVITGILLMSLVAVSVVSDFEGLTGMASQLYVGIKSVINGRITLLSHPSTITQYSTMNITTEFTNIGSAKFIGRIEIYILNANMTETLATYYDGYTELSPGDRRVFRAKYIPRNTSFHWVHVVVPYDRYVDEVWGLFYVFPYYAETVQPGAGTTPGTGTAGSGEAPEYGEMAMELDYPAIVDVVQGGSTIFHITAKNTGGLSIRDLVLSASVEEMNVSLSPSVVIRLYPGSTNVFLVALDVPRDTETGVYKLGFTLNSGNLTRSGNISIRVAGIEEYDDIAMAISNYIFIIGKLGNEIEELGLQGKNTSVAMDHLARAIRNLEDAKNFYETGSRESALEELRKVRSSVMAAADEIARLLSIAVFPLLVAPGYISLSLIILFASVMLMIFLILTKRRKKKKELEEESEREE